MQKVGRNDPCPCESGKKYKKCCLPKDQEQKAVDEENMFEDYEETLEDIISGSMYSAVLGERVFSTSV